ncbi:MAG: SMP-30/gluconolactonase/LRE family protein [Alphaproteobacteria bacterium]|nr:SMP-30/gluconolactonase/LRE family protein [Alphaproteobacteria bacterium]
MKGERRRWHIGAAVAIAVLLTLSPASVGRAGDLVTIVPDAHYPEGPLWHGGKLYFAEMTRHRIAEWNGASRTFWAQRGCGMTSIAPAPGGLFLVTCHLGRAVVWVRDVGRMAALHTEGAGGEPIGNPNDSVADGRGGVYFSSSGRFAPAAAATGAIYRIVPGGTPKRVASNIHYANGVVLGPKEKFLYVSAHLARQVLRFRIARDGSLEERETWLRLADVVKPAPGAGPLAGPDGLTFDAAGNLFIAEYGAGRILVVGPDRRLKKVITVPNRFVTSVEFGPGKHTLYITAPADNNRWPYKGAVYKLAKPLE